MFWYLCGLNKSNFGDLVGPWLYQRITGRPPKYVADARNATRVPELLITCGSLLQQWNMRRNWVVWGSGIYRQTERFPIKPLRVCAVRGPLTRQLLLQNGIPCPEIYGDPALLLPRFYTPQDKSHQFRVGLLPHVSGFHATLKAFASRRHDIKVIDVDRPVEQVCDDIASCEVTLAGSLHGVIVSHAYQIPCAWVRRMGHEERLQDRGDGVKYRDYYASVGVTDAQPIDLVQSVLHLSVDDIVTLVRQYPQPHVMPDLDALMAACPFVSD